MFDIPGSDITSVRISRDTVLGLTPPAYERAAPSTALPEKSNDDSQSETFPEQQSIIKAEQWSMMNFVCHVTQCWRYVYTVGPFPSIPSSFCNHSLWCNTLSLLNTVSTSVPVFSAVPIVFVAVSWWPYVLWITHCAHAVRVQFNNTVVLLCLGPCLVLSLFKFGAVSWRSRYHLCSAYTCSRQSQPLWFLIPRQLVVYTV